MVLWPLHTVLYILNAILVLPATVYAVLCRHIGYTVLPGIGVLNMIWLLVVGYVALVSLYIYSVIRAYMQQRALERDTNKHHIAFLD